MKEYPIIFKGWKIPKIMDGSATMTRRPLKPQPDDDAKITVSKGIAYIGNSTSGGLVTRMPCPYGIPGDHLWVKETYLLHNQENKIWYKADGDPPAGDWDNRWQPSIFMSRKYSRTTLEITNIKVERVQEITEEDAQKEGCGWKCDHPDCLNGIHWARGAFVEIWDSIHGKGAWQRNDWIWAIKYKRIKL